MGQRPETQPPPAALRRLLRNRVSAQQARERKKAYVSDVEARAKEMEERCAALTARVAALERENGVLRSVLKSTTMGEPMGLPLHSTAGDSLVPDARSG